MEALQSREVPRLHLVFHVQFTGKSAYTDGRAQYVGGKYWLEIQLRYGGDQIYKVVI